MYSHVLYYTMYDDVLCMNLVDIFLFQIFDGKMAYNDKLISLRDWKLQVIDKVCHPYPLHVHVYLYITMYIMLSVP